MRVFLVVRSLSTLSDEKRLIKRLLEKYEGIGVIGRPVTNMSQTVSVSYGMSLIQILDVDEKNQVLTINVWSRYVRTFLANIRRRRSKPFRLLVSLLPFRGLSVCLSVCLFVSLSVTFVHCAQTAEYIDTISFAYDSQMSLSERAKIGLTSLSPSSPKFCPKVTLSLLI